MHELSITQNILSIALEQAEINHAKRITKINVTVGELSGIVDECVEFYFELLSKDTIAAGAKLLFNRLSTSLRCRKCDKTFSPEGNNWTCPGCGDSSIEIVSGRESYVNSIEVD